MKHSEKNLREELAPLIVPAAKAELELARILSVTDEIFVRYRGLGFSNEELSEIVEQMLEAEDPQLNSQLKALYE